MASTVESGSKFMESVVNFPERGSFLQLEEECQLLMDKVCNISKWDIVTRCDSCDIFCIIVRSLLQKGLQRLSVVQRNEEGIW